MRGRPKLLLFFTPNPPRPGQPLQVELRLQSKSETPVDGIELTLRAHAVLRHDRIKTTMTQVYSDQLGDGRFVLNNKYTRKMFHLRRHIKNKARSTLTSGCCTQLQVIELLTQWLPSMCGAHLRP